LEWCNEVIGELFSGHQDKGLASIARQKLKNNNIIGATESFLALILGVSLHFQSRF
jgi:hypothetical protein